VAARVSGGFSLVELLISMLLGLALVVMFLVVVNRCRLTFAGTESLAEVHDAARHAMSVLVDDIEHAGFYGGASPERLQLVRGGSVIAETPQLSQGLPGLEVVPVAGLPPGAHDCGVNFAVDLRRAVQATDDHFGLECAPTASAGGARLLADTLTLRRASAEPSEPRAGRLQLWTAALDSSLPLKMFADGRSPTEGAGEVRDLEVRSYYVANDSVGRAGLPALRVKALTESRGGAQFRDEELMPGVEDLQIELGLRSLEDGIWRVSFVTPDTAAARNGTVVAVRLWLRVRAQTLEPGHLDERTLSYSNVTYSPRSADARWRRLLISRTVALRNLHE
jgi:type IV pilus assembly protein PilW